MLSSFPELRQLSVEDEPFPPVDGGCHVIGHVDDEAEARMSPSGMGHVIPYLRLLLVTSSWNSSSTPLLAHSHTHMQSVTEVRAMIACSPTWLLVCYQLLCTEDTEI